MTLSEWTSVLSRSIIERTAETPRVLGWIYDVIDEDLPEAEDEFEDLH
jgi:hypothetical protein